ncbi:MAG: L-proline 4-hydroxylase [Chloroflexota bacterium]|nr:MAG: L-proline 4-hydroxylase [Chloroflexota bacterium]
MPKPIYLNDVLVQQYLRDGFLIVNDVFSRSEVDVLLDAVEHGSRVAETQRALSDTQGRAAKLAIWFDIGNDVWSALTTSPRLVNNARILMGEDIVFFHGKVILKEARQGGAWEWHQDYGYWYNQGFAFPRMLSVSIALDAATKENGCIEVLSGSHRLGRVNHGQFGEQTGIDPIRIKALEPLFERVYCEMRPGSALFFHGNLLHCSGPNNSDHHRRSVIMCYNALSNPLLKIGYDNSKLGEESLAEGRPCPVGPENGILEFARTHPGTR